MEPAEGVGVREMDVILEVNSVDVRHVSPGEVQGYLNMKQGEKVELLILRWAHGHDWVIEFWWC